MDKIICKMCGTINRESARFCASCGQTLERISYQPAGEAQPRGRRRKILSNIGTTIIGLSFIILFCSAVPILMTAQQLLDPDVYKDSLVSQDFYNRFPEAFIEQMDFSKPQKFALEGLPCIDVSEFSSADWRLISDNFLPPDWMQIQAVSVIDQMFTFFDSDADSVAITVTLDPFKNFLADEKGYLVYHEIVKTKRSCSLFDMAAWIFAPSEGCLSVCKPPIDINQTIWDIVRALSGSTPPTYNLGEVFDLTPLFYMRLAVRVIRIARIAAYAGLIVCVGLIGLALLPSKTRPIRNRLFAIGIPTAAAGLMCAVMAISIPMLSTLLGGMLSDQGMAPGFRDLLTDVARSILVPIGSQMGLPAIAAIILGGVMVLPAILSFGKKRIFSEF